jgi:ParB/RepB/Spo0J family partition protein
MPPQIARHRNAALNHGKNIRSDLGSEDELRRLGKSVRQRQQMPLLILADGTVIDGNRRLAAARLEGIEELDCIVIGEDTSPAEIERIQLISALHRADLSAYDKAVAVRDIKEGSPGMSSKQLAEEVLNIDPAMMTKNLALFDCHPAVQDAAKAGLIGVTDWYAIRRAPDQLAALRKALSGATRADLEGEGKRQRNGGGNGPPAVRTPKLKIPLAGDAATGTVTVAGAGDIDLDAAEAILKEAQKLIRSAREKNLDPKTAQAVWRDMAKAGG